MVVCLRSLSATKALTAAFSAFIVLSTFACCASGSPLIPDGGDGSRLTRRAPHPAILQSPAAGQVLEPGGSVKVEFFDGETSSIQASIKLANISYTYTLAPSPISFTSPYHLSAFLSLPTAEVLFPGAYRFMVFELPESGSVMQGEGQLAANVEVHLGLGQGEALVLQGKEREREREKRGEGEKREPHSATIESPAAGSTLAAGSSFNLLFRDGETDASSVQLVLSGNGQSYTLGQVEFSSYQAQGSFTIPADAPAGTYTLDVQENSNAAPSTYTTGLNETLTITSSGSSGSSAMMTFGSNTANSTAFSTVMSNTSTQPSFSTTSSSAAGAIATSTAIVTPSTSTSSTSSSSNPTSLSTAVQTVAPTTMSTSGGSRLGKFGLGDVAGWAGTMVAVVMGVGLVVV